MIISVAKLLPLNTMLFELNQDLLQWNQELMSGGAVELKKILGSKDLEYIIFN